jgi:hypothetical protein
MAEHKLQDKAEKQNGDARMLRAFDEHRVRETASLDGLWDFVIASDRSDRGRLPKSYTRTIHVPSAWEMLPGLENYRGKAGFGILSRVSMERRSGWSSEGFRILGRSLLTAGRKGPTTMPSLHGM